MATFADRDAGLSLRDTAWVMRVPGATRNGGFVEYRERGFGELIDGLAIGGRRGER